MKKPDVLVRLITEMQGWFIVNRPFNISNYHFYKKNGMCFISYQGEAEAHPTGTVLFTIPEGYRPKMPDGLNQFFFLYD